MTELLSKVKTSEEIIYILTMKREINPSEEYVRLNKSVLSRLGDLNTVTKEDIAKFLDKLRKPETEDALHKWIGTYNKYYTILKKFFKWFGAPYSMEGFKELKRKERSQFTNLLTCGHLKMILYDYQKYLELYEYCNQCYRRFIDVE